VDDLLDQRLAGTLGDATMDLTARQQRIDHHADVVDHEIAVEHDGARLGVDFDLADVTTIGETRHVRGEGAVTPQADAEFRRQADRDKRHLRHLEDRHRPIGAGDRKGAVVKAMSAALASMKCAAKRLPRSITSSAADLTGIGARRHATGWGFRQMFRLGS
jgi:hypothetical protein